MGINKSIRVAFIAVCTLIVSFGSLSTVADAATKYYLPTKTTKYEYNTKNKSWKKVGTSSIKYNKKGYAVKMKCREYGTPYTHTIKYKYYSNKKLKQKIIKNGYLGETIKYKYNKKGKLISLYGEKVSVNKRGFLKKTLSYSGKHKIKYKYYKGFPKKITAGKDYSVLNKKGLVTKAKFQMYGETSIVTFKYKYGKGGRVKSVVITDRTGNETYKYKIVYSYSKAKRTKSKKKWSVMIGSDMQTSLGPYYQAVQAFSPYDCAIE